MTTTTRPAGNGTAPTVRTTTALAPKIELIASQAIVASQLMPAGTTIDLPKGKRDKGICASPVRGPMTDSTPTSAAPMTLPTTIAAKPVQKPSPMNGKIASVPRKNVAGARFGANQTVKSRSVDP